MTKWLYGDAWEKFPIEAGQVWGLENGSRVAVHNIFDPLPAFMLLADMLFVDPPWNKGNLNSFYTKAGRSDYIADFAAFEAAIFQRIDDIAPRVCYLEVGFQAVEKWETRIAERYARVTVWPVTYYKRNRCFIVRGGDSPAPRDYTGMDEAEVIRASAQVEDCRVIGDFCMGLGLVGLAAFDAGKSFVGTELNRRRLANLLQALAKRGAHVQPC